MSLRVPLPLSTVNDSSSRHDPARLTRALERFRAWGDRACSDGKATWTLDSEPLVLTLKGRRDQGRVILGTLIHGNEYGPLEAVTEWAEQLVTTQAGSQPFPLDCDLQIIVANTSAALLGRRFLEADLNRLFAPGGASGDGNHEERLASALRPLLTGDDILAFVDLHQTIEASDRAFFIFGFHAPSLALTRALSPEVTKTVVTRNPRQSFVAGQMSGDEWVRFQGRPAVTLELGQKGFDPETTIRTRALLANLAVFLQDAARFETLYAPQDASQLLSGIEAFHTVARVPFDGPRAALRAGIANFAAVADGQELGHTDGGQPLRCPAQGFALFPKYPSRDSTGVALPPVPADILNVVAPLSTDEVAAWLEHRS